MVLYKNKPRGVEMGEQMSSLNGSIIYEAALVTNVPIKRLSLYVLWIRQAQNFDVIWRKTAQNISNFPTPQCLFTLYKPWSCLTVQNSNKVLQMMLHNEQQPIFLNSEPCTLVSYDFSLCR